VTSDVRSEVELRQFRISTMKNMQYNPYIYGKSLKFLHSKENKGERTRQWHQILDRKWKYGNFVHAQCIWPQL